MRKIITLEHKLVALAESQNWLDWLLGAGSAGGAAVGIQYVGQ